MNNNEPIFIYVGTGHSDVFMAALHEIIQKSPLPIIILEEPEPFQPREFCIPDVKIQDFILPPEPIKKPTRIHTSPNKNTKNYKQTYRNFRDVRNKIKLQTHRIQRIK